jgi:membrane protease YdiL (CAAX protease family)
MKRGGLAAFFAITFGYTWGLGLAYVLFPTLTKSAIGPVSFSNPFIVSAVYSPSIAALIVASLAGRKSVGNLVSRLFRWRMAWYWYVGPVVFIATVGLGAQIVSALVFGTAWPLFAPAQLPSLAAAGLAAFAFDPGPLGEELGWRGFALPRMVERWNGLVAALVLGTIWGVWHLPAFFIPGMPQSEIPIWTFMIAIVAASVVITWVVNKTGSVLPAILIHWADNRFGELHYPAALMTAFMFAIAALVLVMIAGVDLGAKREARVVAPELQPAA